MNWIPDRNRFGLPKPPSWFLQALWDQDPALVIIPSRQVQKYLLARRREFSKTISRIVAKSGGPARVVDSDSDLLASLNLVLVDTITGNVHFGSWMRSGPEILADLRKRDMWAVGADKFVDQIEQVETEKQIRDRAALESNLEYRAADAWRSYQARTGQRTRVGAGMSRTSRAKIVQVGTL